MIYSVATSQRQAGIYLLEVARFEQSINLKTNLYAPLSGRERERLI